MTYNKNSISGTGESALNLKDVAKILNLTEGSVSVMLVATRKGKCDFPLPTMVDGRNVWEPDVIEAYRIKRVKESSEKTVNKEQAVGTNDSTPDVVTSSEIVIAKPSTPGLLIEPKNNGGVRMLNLANYNSAKVSEKRRVEEPGTEVRVVEARKPNPQEHIRVRPGNEWQYPVKIIHYKPSSEFWLVTPEIADNKRVAKDVCKAMLHVVVNEFGVTYIWPVKMKRNTWDNSCREAAKDAVNGWIRVIGDFQQNRFNTYPAENDLGTPRWSDFSLSELVSYAFDGMVVEDLDSPILQKLWGVTD